MKFLITLVGFLSVGCALQAQSPKPNVLFIVIDDLNDYAFEDGHPEAYAPNLATLAARGTRFTNAFCSSPLCAPSRISIISGKDPEYTQVYSNEKTFEYRNFFTAADGNETVYTLPEVMKDSGGYFTFGINKIFHNFFRPEFDNDYDVSTTDPCSRSKSWSVYEKYPDDPSLSTPNDGLPGGYGWGKVSNSEEDLLTDYRAVDRTINFLDQYALDPSSYCNRPFFMALGLIRPHTPQFIPAKYFPTDYVDDIYDTPFDLPYNEPYNQYPPNGFIMPPRPDDPMSDYDGLPSMGKVLARENINRHDAFIQYAQNLSTLPEIDPLLTDSARRRILEDTKRANAVMAYWSAVRFIDAQVGRLIDHLDTHPSIRDNTIIVVLSDHGYSLGERTHWHKQSLWDTDTRVPLLIVDPSRPGGARCQRTVSTLDIYPTLLEMTGTGEPTFPDGSRYPDGSSLTALLDNPQQPWERPVLSSIMVGDDLSDGWCFPQYSVRSERFHYIRYKTNGDADCTSALSDKQEELYEIGPQREVDPFEWNDLAADPDHKVVKSYLSNWLPGGSSYLSSNLGLRVNTDDVPCRLDGNDTLRLSAVLFDENGLEIAPPLGTSIRWRVIPYNQLFSGQSIEIALHNIDSALFDHLDELEFQAALYNPGLGVLSFDSRVISINGSGPPEVSWNVIQDGPTVQITDLAVDGDYASSYWEFGDTYRSDDFWNSPFDANFQDQPSTYTYSFPGSYDIVQHVFYGTDNDALCELTDTFHVEVPDSLFEDLPCLTPGLVRLEALVEDSALLRWAPVFADDFYEVRYKLSRDFDVPWTFVSSPVPTRMISGLEAGKEYGISVRAFCDTGRTSTRVSDWSFPFRQMAVSCDYPIGIAVDSLFPDAALLSWDPVPGIEFYEIAWRELGTPFNVVPVGDRTSVMLEGLTPGASYGFGVRSHCAQIFSQEEVPGEFSAPVNFVTPSPAPRLHQEAELDRLLIYPNPASDLVEIRIPLAIEGDWELDLFDLQGRLVIASEDLPSRVSGQWSVDISPLPQGSYFARVTNKQEALLRTIVVLR